MNDQCLYPKCSKPVRCRGLCNNHYTYTAHMVKWGKLEWDDLVRRGKCLKTGKRGKQGGFTDWIEGVDDNKEGLDDNR